MKTQKIINSCHFGRWATEVQKHFDEGWVIVPATISQDKLETRFGEIDRTIACIVEKEVAEIKPTPSL